MPTMNLKEMREREDGELRQEIEKLRKEFFDLRFKSATEAVASPARFHQIRRDVARLEALLRQRELGIASASTAAKPRPAGEAAAPAKAGKPAKSAKAKSAKPKSAKTNKAAGAGKAPRRAATKSASRG
jgi:large subunit ribosomal protein L29